MLIALSLLCRVEWFDQRVSDVDRQIYPSDAMPVDRVRHPRCLLRQTQPMTNRYSASALCVGALVDTDLIERWLSFLSSVFRVQVSVELLLAD